jgi:hypothetical protein
MVRLFIAALIFFACVVVWNESLAFMLAASSCRWPEPPGGRREAVRVLLVSDVHVLGRRRRSWMDIFWTDWQLLKSFRAAIDWAQPDVALVLGDLMDEGKGAIYTPEYDAYSRRFLRIFGARHRSSSGTDGSGTDAGDAVLPRTRYLPGNHDVDLGPLMTRAHLSEYRRMLGPENTAFTVRNVSFLALNAAALVDGVAPDLAADTERFMAAHYAQPLPPPQQLQQIKLADSGIVHRTQRPILLLHIPLFRRDDRACGLERSLERGHVTYEPPEAPLAQASCNAGRAVPPLRQFSLACANPTLPRLRCVHALPLSPPWRPTNQPQNLDVLPAVRSRQLLERLQPRAVFSGHTHSMCRYLHRSSDGNRVTPEFTVPTFSWRMRPDPYYALATIPILSSSEDAAATITGADAEPDSAILLSLCPLPNEHVALALYVLSVALLALATCLTALRKAPRARAGESSCMVADYDDRKFA